MEFADKYAQINNIEQDTPLSWLLPQEIQIKIASLCLPYQYIVKHNLITIFKELPYSVQKKAFLRVIHYGNIQFLNLLYARGHAIYKHYIYYAISEGQLKVVRWLFERCSAMFGAEEFFHAVKLGNVAMVEFFLRFIWHPKAIDVAIIHNHLRLLAFFHAKELYTYSFTHLATAIKYDNLKIIGWLCAYYVANNPVEEQFKLCVLDLILSTKCPSIIEYIGDKITSWDLFKTGNTIMYVEKIYNDIVNKDDIPSQHMPITIPENEHTRAVRILRYISGKVVFDSNDILRIIRNDNADFVVWGLCNIVQPNQANLGKFAARVFIRAVGIGNLNLATYMLENYTFDNRDYVTALETAAINCNLDMLKLLCDDYLKYEEAPRYTWEVSGNVVIFILYYYYNPKILDFLETFFKINYNNDNIIMAISTEDMKLIRKIYESNIPNKLSKAEVFDRVSDELLLKFRLRDDNYYKFMIQMLKYFLSET